MNYTINVRGRLLSLAHPQVMGILNVTPDSFYCGSRKQTEREIADRANEIIAQSLTAPTRSSHREEPSST